MLVWVLPLGRIAPGNLRSGSLQRVAINAELDGNIGSLAIGVVGEDELLKIGESATFCLSMWGRAVSLRRRSEAQAHSLFAVVPLLNERCLLQLLWSGLSVCFGLDLRRRLRLSLRLHVGVGLGAALRRRSVATLSMRKKAFFSKAALAFTVPVAWRVVDKATIFIALLAFACDPRLARLLGVICGARFAPRTARTRS